MKSPRLLLYVLAGATVLAGLAFAGRAFWQKRAVWTAARPVRPDLGKWPEPFRTRVAAVEARLAASTGDTAALGELSRLYHANGFLAEAEHSYRALLGFDPAEARWPHLLAGLLAAYGRLDEAVPLWRQTIALAPGYTPARLHLADALVKLNRPDDAAAAYRNLLVVAPKDPYALLGLARLDLGAKRLAEARGELQQALAADPKFFAAHSLLATVETLRGDAAAADAARGEAAKEGRFHEAPDAWTEELLEYCYDIYRLQVAAAARAESHNWQGAVTLLERTLTLTPDNAASRRQLGKAFVGLADYPHAREQLEKAVALDPHNPAVYVDLVVVYRTIGDLPAAASLLEKAFPLCPEDAGLNYYYGLVLIVNGQLADAVLHLERARQLSPEKPLAAQDLIRTYFRLNRESEAIAVMEEEMARHPEVPAFLLMATRYRIMKHEATEAAALLLRARTSGLAPGELGALAEEFYGTFGYLPQ